jgi:Clp amino terminal domain, pathogenicity island component
MAYKGADLDLRTPRLGTSSATSSGEAGAPPLREPAGNGGTRMAGSFGAPIAVDETVLACCNRAYDIARFHGAADVRLEHLLHALTRVGAAQEALAELGIRVDSLRRDTAVAIAADLPTSPLEIDASPRASVAFAHVLRRGADQAGRWYAPAGVHDLVRTMLGGGPGSPAATLLMKAAADPQRLERWRDAPLRGAFDAAAPEASAGAVAGPVPPELAEAFIGRLEAMASSLQGMEAQAAADRQALSARLGDAQSALQALGGEGAAGSHEALLGKLGELEKMLGVLANRLVGIDGLASTGDAWQELRERMRAIEGRLGAQALDVANRVGAAVAERLEGAQTGLRHLEEETEKRWSSNGERQIALEASVRALLKSAEEADKKHERDLNEIYQALVKLGANQQTLGDNFTAWRIESGGDIGIVSNRVQQLERTVLDLLGHLGTDLRAWRQESREGGNGVESFKRWLYGTSKAFASGWREEAALPREAGKPPKEADKVDKAS